MCSHQKSEIEACTMPAIGAIAGWMDDRQAPPGELRCNYTSVGQVVLLVHGFGAGPVHRSCSALVIHTSC